MGTNSTGGGVATSGVQTGSQLISPGIITRMNLRTDKVFQEVGEQFWSVHLAFNPTVDDGVIDTLVQGYVQFPQSLTWHGFLELSSEVWIIIEGVGIMQQQANAAESRITLTKDGALTKYLLKTFDLKATA